ncbi:MAG: fibronectin type III domain-containing protein [Patescibacteria group bacterium]
MSKKLYRLNLGMALTLFVIVALTATVFWIKAVDISNAQDLMSNQSVGGFSTHRISFNLSGGNTFSAGEFVVVDFPSDFFIANSWQPSDFTFLDSNPRTVLAVDYGSGVTSVACSQNTGNEVGVAVDTDTVTFRVVPCTGAPAFNASAVGASVSLTINGANPNGTLVNPATSGSFKVEVTDAAGDCVGGCGIWVPIVDSSLVMVTASVESDQVCGNGIVEPGEQCDDNNLNDGDGCSSLCRQEGGGSTPTDSTPPVIDYHCAIDITQTSATVYWDTDEYADSLVRCGTQHGVYTIVEQDTSFVLEHLMPLTELTPATLYYCQGCSKDMYGNMGCSDECVFSTSDEAPPDVTEVRCTDPTLNSFTIRWTTDEPSSSFVDYGLDPGPPYGATTGIDDLVMEHVVTVLGLEAGVNYHFRARSGDTSGNEVLSSDTICGTAGGELPSISNLQAIEVGCTSAKISWTTNVGTDSQVNYDVISGPPYANSMYDPAFVLNHLLALTGLTPGTTYYYRPISVDMSSNSAIGDEQWFTTFDDGPLTISSVSAIDILPNTATIVWHTDKNADSRVDYGENGNYSNSVSDSSWVMDHAMNLSLLDACTEYIYRVTSADICDGTRTESGFRFTTTANEPPVISNVQAIMVTEDSARITWNTQLPANSIVEYGTTTAYGQTASGGSMSVLHQVVLNGLTPGTTYYFRAHSADTCRQDAYSERFDFTTVDDNDPPACALNLRALPGDSMAYLSWDNPTDDDFVGSRVLRKTGGCPTDQNDGTIIYEGLNETLVDDGLINGVSYCYGAFPYDNAGNFGCGAIASVTPEGAPDISPPACPSNFVAQPRDREVLLSWDDPSDADFAGVKVQRGPGNMCPVNHNDGLTIYEGTGNTWVDATVTNGVEYCYGLYSFDAALNYCPGVTRTATPTGTEDVTPPICASHVSVLPGDGSLLVIWENPPDADWVGTRVVRRADSYPTGPEDGTVIFDGIGDHVLDLGLVNGVTYYYGVFSYDEIPNFCIGAYGRGTPEEGALPPVTSCTDTDGGRNYFSRGTVKLTEDLQYIDACIDQDILQENYCSEGDLAMEDYDCGTGYKCSAGRCIPDVYEPPTQRCGNGICEQPFCNIDCGAMTYDLYIINPDGSERHMFTEWVEITELEPNLNIISFEDKGEDWDYNDVEFRLDTRDCRAISVTLVSHNAAWNHQVRLLVSYRQVPKLDRLVWHDSHVDIGQSVYINATDDPSICQGTENSINCPEDCPAGLPIPPVDETSTVEEDERLYAEALEFYATEGRLPLVVADETVTVFPAMAVTTVLPFEELPKPVRSVYFNFEGSTYVMVPTEAGYEAKMVMPTESGEYPFAVIVEYEDGTVDVIYGNFRVVPFGQVVEQIDDRLVGVDETRVTLLVDLGGGNYGVWDGEQFGQYNPMYSSENGSYGFIVPPGVYILRAEKPGYRTQQTLPFPVEGNVINRNLLMISKPGDSLLGYIFGPDFLHGIGAYLGYGADIANDEWNEFSDNPFVEGAVNDMAPGVAALSAANVLVAGAATATAVPYLLYLYSFLTHPSLLLAARRRKKWGVVFNSITKKPIDLVIVRLLDEKTGKIIRSMVTDKDGRYFFMVNRGAYRMVVAKAGFVFPTVYLKGEEEDIRFTDLYHGEQIDVTESTSITANIPIDPIIKEKTPRRVVWEGITRRFQRSISIVTLVAMAGAAIITPTPFVLGLFAANILMYLFFRRLAKGGKPKNWGIVYDDLTKKPLRNAVVRVFESRYNKLLETRVTDMRGRYAFLVGNNVYYVTYEKPGYQKKQIGPIDLMEVKKEEDQLIASDMSLESVEHRGLWQSFAERMMGLVNPLGTSKAKIDREPLAEKIGKTGGLIVGPDVKIEQIKAEQEAKLAKQAAIEKQKQQEAAENQVPWELKAIQKMTQPTPSQPVTTELPKVGQSLPAIEPIKVEEKPADQVVENKPKNNVPWELQELHNLRYDSDQLKNDKK